LLLLLLLLVALCATPVADPSCPQIKGLLRFDTSHNDSYSPETMTSFEEYSDRMHEDQKRM